MEIPRARELIVDSNLLPSSYTSARCPYKGQKHWPPLVRRSELFQRSVDIIRKSAIHARIMSSSDATIASAAQVAGSEAKAAKSPTKKKAAGSKNAAKKPVLDHPKYSEMVKAALTNLKERGGSSRQAVLKYIVKNFKVGTDENVVNTHLKMALRAGVKNASLKQSKGSGATGSFRLGEEAKKKAKKPAAAKPAKAKKSPAKAVKKPAKVAKSSSPKKPIAKKAVAATKKPKAAAKPAAAKKTKADKPKKAVAPKKASPKKTTAAAPKKSPAKKVKTAATKKPAAAAKPKKVAAKKA